MTENEWQQKWGIQLLNTPQAFCRLPREAYDELPGINASLCKEVIAKTLAHAWENCINPDREPQEEKDDFIQGNITHCSVLEWDEFDRRYVLAPDLPSRPTPKQLEEPPELTKTGKPAKAHETWREYKRTEALWLEWEKKNLPPGAQIVSPLLYAKGINAGLALLNHPVLGARYAKTEQHRLLNEITFTYIDPLTKRRIKARIDSLRIYDGLVWIGDIKTAQDAGEEGFGKAIVNFHYIVQAAFYHDAVFYCRAEIERILGLQDGALITLPILFEWVAIEKAIPKPEFIGRHYLTEEQLTDGRRLYRIAVNKLHSSYATDYFPGYSTAAKPAVLPPWYQRSINQTIARLEES
jgi:exodeoxyribonuclease VIII